MQGKTKLVTVIIPAYNAAAFIKDTIESIRQQTYPHWEIVVVDDGSTDDTQQRARSFKDVRIWCISQTNSGVATARNNGLLRAAGDYVVFFDADDIMAPDFLKARLEALEEDKTIGFVGGAVESFPVGGELRKAAGTDPVNEILFFDAAFVTVPSNYMFRKKVLLENKVKFNSRLSSSADRFFILELSKYTKGKNITGDSSKLLYRYTAQSMSNKVTAGLIIDNERFYFELKKKHLLPAGRESKFRSFYFLSLAKGFGMVKHWKAVCKYLVKSFVNDPFFFAGNFGKSVVRASFGK